MNRRPVSQSVQPISRLIPFATVCVGAPKPLKVGVWLRHGAPVPSRYSETPLLAQVHPRALTVTEAYSVVPFTSETNAVPLATAGPDQSARPPGAVTELVPSEKLQLPPSTPPAPLSTQPTGAPRCTSPPQKRAGLFGPQLLHGVDPPPVLPPPGVVPPPYPPPPVG